jgi:hypothetical protein
MRRVDPTTATFRWALAVFAMATIGVGQAGAQFKPKIPKVWVQRDLQEMELPLTVERYSPRAGAEGLLLQNTNQGNL